MDVRTASRPRAGRPDEDLLVVKDAGAVLLDGAGLPDVAGPGQVAAYVAALARRLAGSLAGDDRLPRVLGGAITEVPSPPGVMAAVAMVRLRPMELEVLVLGDISVLVVADGETTVVHDPREVATREAVLASYDTHVERVSAFRAHRNRPGGFWVASEDPDAAHQAIVRTWPRTHVTDVVLLSNGLHGIGADEVVRLLRRDGPAALLARSLPGDDATVAWLTLGDGPG